MDDEDRLGALLLDGAEGEDGVAMAVDGAGPGEAGATATDGAVDGRTLAAVVVAATVPPDCQGVAAFLAPRGCSSSSDLKDSGTLHKKKGKDQHFEQIDL